jgi:hypothetical protein
LDNIKLERGGQILPGIFKQWQSTSLTLLELAILVMQKQIVHGSRVFREMLAYVPTNWENLRNWLTASALTLVLLLDGKLRKTESSCLIETVPM